MPQYTSTFTGFANITTNSILDSTTNTQTITVTAPTGQVATVTVNSTSINSDFDNIVSDLAQQLNDSGADVGRRGIVQGLEATTENVINQKQTAIAVSTATDTPPPNEKQAIPIVPDSDPAEPTPLVISTDILTEPPDSGVGDEFGNLETAIDNQSGLQEPPLLNDQEVESYLSEQQTPEYGLLEDPELIDPSEDAAENAKFARQQEEANNPVSFSDSPSATGSSRGLLGKTKKTRAQATAQANSGYKNLEDWRVKLSLAQYSNYLYNANPPGILAPLKYTDGVIFPYTPSITVQYTANYDPTELVHSNYKMYNYRNSGIDNISIVGDFTAQDTYEANYLLAVMHFFRSITKMFYGQDSLPVNGTPPPLCYLYGYGQFGYSKHPLAIYNFSYTLPNDVDYIRATTASNTAGVTNTNKNIPQNENGGRQLPTGVGPGGNAPTTEFKNIPENTSNNTGGDVEPTYVPTKIQLTINAYPIISRNDISRRFSLQKYATGELLLGKKQPNGGGIW